ncbi:MAG: aminotransferase DegT, partial [Gemmatimonadales bacterium]|nr:aminotransferase DegT [Gemmatimonadales bacterium]
MKVNIAEASLSPAEIAAATRVLESGALRQGKECQGFEVEFAEYVDAAFGVTCSNGSASLHLAFMTF